MPLEEYIIKYNGDIDNIKNNFSAQLTALSSGYAIIKLDNELLPQLETFWQIEYVELPRRLYTSVVEGKSASCIPSSLSSSGGTNVLIGVIDSGIDYMHPLFINDNKTSKILELWDQNISGSPPAGYYTGTLFSNEQITTAIQENNRSLVPSTDISGHGTHVTGICSSIAPESELLIVKLGSPAQTARLMEALNYIVLRAQSLNKPIAINLSYGNNYGAHNGKNITEQFIDEVAGIGKNSICIGSGNEGSSSRHAGGILTQNTPQKIEFVIGGKETSITMELWKNYNDSFLISILTPSQKEIPIYQTGTYEADDTTLYIYYQDPTPFNILQEITIALYPQNTLITENTWSIILTPQKINDGRYDIWLPSASSVNTETRFLRPDIYTTLTIPSTAYRAITVSAYNSRNDSFADFSGRGYTRNYQVKPDITAPGVDIVSAAPNGGYTTRSGTSMATPFVTGAAALLMQWGITERNDLNMYGEKLKANLIKGARQLPGEETPSPKTGWGVLCLQNSIPR